MNLNTGKDLESLVRRLEELLIPDGFDIGVNRRVLDDDGVQLAEFDIEIRSVAGLRSVSWLIECRDRPSQGAAPSSWIEQLVGRRELHHLDQVIAVSTTGFSEPAIRLARQANIVLRRVENVADLASDFRVVGFHLVTCLGGGGTIQVDAEGHEDFEFNLRNLFVRPMNRADPLRFADFVCEQLGPSNGVDETRQVRIVHNEAIELRIGERTITARGLHADVEVTRQVLEGTALAAKQYSQEGLVIGQEGMFAWQLQNGLFRARIQVVKLGNGTESCRVELLDALPDTWQGREVSIYGRNKT